MILLYFENVNLKYIRNLGLVIFW